jgi:N-acetylglucosaminyldiphosphoundecaprenol N-acetyl-beta-D-mannosaminyltransferase
METERIRILRSEVDKVTKSETLDRIKFFLSAGAGHYAVTLNSEMIVRAEDDAEFREIIRTADLVVADGMGVLRASSYIARKCGHTFPDLLTMFVVSFESVVWPAKVSEVLPERISGIDLIQSICASDFARGKRIYLLGAEKGIAARAAAVLLKTYPHIAIAGTMDGFWQDDIDHASMIGRINASHADILFVALGAPKQEKWICDNLPDLPSVKFAMGVGGSFDILAGKRRRAPALWQSHGLEWCWRLLLEPRRWRRIYAATWKLSWLIFRDKKDKIIP